MAIYELTFQSVHIPTNSGGISVTVEEDSNNDGTVENSDTISLSDGVTTYTTGDVFADSGKIRLKWSIGPANDVTVSADTLLPVEVTSSINDVSPAETSVLNYLTATATALIPDQTVQVNRPTLSYTPNTITSDIGSQASNPTLKYLPLLQKQIKTRTLPEYDLTPVGIVEDTMVEWDADIGPGQEIRFEVSLDGGNTWTEVNNGDSIPGLSPGDIVLGESLLVRQILETRGINETPTLEYSKIKVTSKKTE